MNYHFQDVFRGLSMEIFENSRKMLKNTTTFWSTMQLLGDVYGMIRLTFHNLSIDSYFSMEALSIGWKASIDSKEIVNKELSVRGKFRDSSNVRHEPLSIFSFNFAERREEKK